LKLGVGPEVLVGVSVVPSAWKFTLW